MGNREQIGVVVTDGPGDWTIVQQRNGQADIELKGCWHSGDIGPEGAQVCARVLREDNGASITSWIPCDMLEEKHWRVELRAIPAGGLYRIETCLEIGDSKIGNWPLRGDILRHIGVGDLWVMAGQSNASGFGRGPVEDPPELGVHLLRECGQWDIAAHPFNEATRTIHSELYESSNCGHSPYLAFARQIKREVGYPIGLIPTAMGGAPLKGWLPEVDGIIYRKMMRVIGLAGGCIRGILWYQGESDTGAETDAVTYLERFRHLVELWRKDVGDDRLPELTVQLNRYTHYSPDGEWDRKWGIVREMQRRASLEIPHVFAVPSLDCPLSDQIHNSPAGNLLIGERLGKTALAEVYGREALYKAPDVNGASIGAVNAEGLPTVDLSFANVVGPLIQFGQHEQPFRVEDDEGEIPVRSWGIVGSSGITLTLDRRPGRQARVHGACEVNPAAWLPTDSVTFLPMLAFYGVTIDEPLNHI